MSSSDHNADYLGADALKTLTEYYGIPEDRVIDRLAHEAEAARLYSQIPELIGDDYAGAWFDEQTFKLTVGLTDQEHAPLVERLGATAVLVEHSLHRLNGTREQIERARSEGQVRISGLVTLGIDYPTNQLALGVLPGYQSAMADALASLSIDSRYYRFHEVSDTPQLSSQIRGADCYENPTYSGWQGSPYQCSIGFSVQGGFITAGHCGEALQNIESCSGTPMGEFKQSTWHSQPAGQRTQDSGWVDTNTSWQPVALVNGYAAGILSVTAEAGGYREVPVNSTVCRYGKASGQSQGAPHCGQVVAKNQLLEICGSVNVFGTCTQYEYIQGTTETNICVEFGDSGGSYLSGAGHAQGTTIGGLNGTCPNASESWFQPTEDTLNSFTLNLLTSHGSNPPTITSFNCPDTANSGGGQYLCQMEFDTQGATTISWTSNTGNSSSGEILFGSCSPSSTVNVNLSVTNPWGVTQQSTNFPCPSGPIP